MADQPPRFRRAPTGTEPPPRAVTKEDRVLAYQLALKLSQQLFVVIELAEGTERIYLRDTLDKRSTTIPQLVAKALSTPEMVRRRGLFENARIYATECEAILDVLVRRGSVEEDALAPALASCRELRDHLATLTVPPRTDD
jgi:hypothetical protein